MVKYAIDLSSGKGKLPVTLFVRDNGYQRSFQSFAIHTRACFNGPSGNLMEIPEVAITPTHQWMVPGWDLRQMAYKVPTPDTVHETEPVKLRQSATCDLPTLWFHMAYPNACEAQNVSPDWGPWTPPSLNISCWRGKRVREREVSKSHHMSRRLRANPFCWTTCLPLTLCFLSIWSSSTGDNNLLEVDFNLVSQNFSQISIKIEQAAWRQWNPHDRRCD